MAGVELLPVELLARILSRLRVGRAKEQLLKVSVQFCRAMLLPAAHDDFALPVHFPTEPNGPTGGYLCPPEGVEQVKLRRLSSTLWMTDTKWIAWVKLNPSIYKQVYIHSDPWQAQEAHLDDVDATSLPVLPQVKVLSAAVCEGSLARMQHSLCRAFPNVESLELYFLSGDADLEDKVVLHQLVSHLPKLRQLAVRGCLVSCRLPDSCKLVMDVSSTSFPFNFPVPQSITKHLIWVCIDGHPSVNCQLLQPVVI